MEILFYLFKNKFIIREKKSDWPKRNANLSQFYNHLSNRIFNRERTVVEAINEYISNDINAFSTREQQQKS